MKRREFITLLGGAVAAWPLAGLAQEGGKVRRIGFLRVGEPPAAFIDGFRRGLREVGLVEGRDFVIEFALPQSTAQVPGAAAELVRRRVDILLASGTPSVQQAAVRFPAVLVLQQDRCPVCIGAGRQPRRLQLHHDASPWTSGSSVTSAASARPSRRASLHSSSRIQRWPNDAE